MKTARVEGEERDLDGGKLIRGRERHILVDCMGQLLAVVVHSAGIIDRTGARHVLKGLETSFPRLRLIWVDVAYTGEFEDWVAALRPQRKLLLEGSTRSKIRKASSYCRDDGS